MVFQRVATCWYAEPLKVPFNRGHQNLFFDGRPGAVASSTIARWIKSILLSAGVDTSFCTAHSTRGASSSKAATSGVTLNNILDTDDGTSAGTFRIFYLRLPIEKQLIDQEVQSHQDYTTAVLSSSKLHCDMEPEPSNVQSQNG